MLATDPVEVDKLKQELASVQKQHAEQTKVLAVCSNAVVVNCIVVHCCILCIVVDFDCVLLCIVVHSVIVLFNTQQYAAI